MRRKKQKNKKTKKQKNANIHSNKVTNVNWNLKKNILFHVQNLPIRHEYVFSTMIIVTSDYEIIISYCDQNKKVNKHKKKMFISVSSIYVNASSRSLNWLHISCASRLSISLFSDYVTNIWSTYADCSFHAHSFPFVGRHRIMY